MMKVNYKVFSKHAEKVAKKASDARPMLKGIEHREDGTLTVTDSHRLYRAYNVNAPKNVVLDAVTGEEIDHGNYPNTDNILPDRAHVTAVMHSLDVKQLKAMLKAMQTAGKADGTKADDILLYLEGNKLGLESKIEGVKFEFELYGDQGVNEAMAFRLHFVLEAVEMMEDMKATELEFRFYGKMRPFTITPKGSEEVMALILPVRKY